MEIEKLGFSKEKSEINQFYVLQKTATNNAVFECVPVERMFQIDEETLLEPVELLQIAENRLDRLLGEEVRPALHRLQVAVDQIAEQFDVISFGRHQFVDDVGPHRVLQGGHSGRSQSPGEFLTLGQSLFAVERLLAQLDVTGRKPSVVLASGGPPPVGIGQVEDVDDVAGLQTQLFLLHGIVVPEGDGQDAFRGRAVTDRFVFRL